MYGKNNIENFVKKEIESGRLRYIDDKKIQVWSQSRGLQLPKLADTTLDKNNILHKADIVNNIIRNDSKNYSISENTELSKLYESTQSSPMLTEETKKELANIKDNFYYKKIRNDETMIRALAEINSNYDKAFNQFVRLVPAKASTIDIAKGFVLMRPDAFITVKYGGWKFLFFVEIHISNNEFNYDKYKRVRKTGSHMILTQDINNFPYVLVVTDEKIEQDRQIDFVKIDTAFNNFNDVIEGIIG